MATHSSVLACRIPGTGEPGGLLSMGSHGIRHNLSNLAAAAETVLMIDVVGIYTLYLPCPLCMWKSLSRVQLFAIPRTVAHQVPLFMGILQARILVWVHALLQGIFPTQGSNPGLPHCRRILNQRSHQGSPLRSIKLWGHVLYELLELTGGNKLQLSTVGTCLITKPLFANFPSLFTSSSPTSICKDNM